MTAKLSGFIESSILTSSVTDVADFESWAVATAGASISTAARAYRNRRIVSVMVPLRNVGRLVSPAMAGVNQED
jgi:hypothetical protein